VDYRPMPLSEDDIAAARADLDDIAKQEGEAQAMNQIKNELEADIYSSREKVERDDIIKVSIESQREEVIKICTEYEEWMYESSTDKSEYESRLNKIKELLGPMEERASELEAREDIPDKVQDAVSKMHKFHADLAKNKTWVNETKLEGAFKKVTDFDEWWAKRQESQKGLPLHEAPAYTKAEVNEQLKTLKKDWDKAIKAATKKPKEEKKKAKGNGTNSSSNATQEEPEKEEVLPGDAKAVQAELDSVREKKLAAVEAEDFDAAHVLKKREEKLKAHLATLEDKSEL